MTHVLSHRTSQIPVLKLEGTECEFKAKRAPEYDGLLRVKDSAFSLSFTYRYCRLYYTALYIYDRKKRVKPTCAIDLNDAVIGASLNKLRLRIIAKGVTYHMKARTETDFSRWLEAIREAREIKEDDEIVLKVYFLDGAFINVNVTDETTAEDLWKRICERLSLEDDCRPSFFIWAIGSRLEVLLRNYDKIKDVLRDWNEKYVPQYSDNLESPPFVVFRRSPFSQIERELQFHSEKAIYLLYSEAVFVFLINGYYTSRDQRHYLSGLIAHVLFGDAKEGLEAEYRHSLPKLVPGSARALIKQKKGLKEVRAVQVEHAKHRGTPLEAIYRQFLKVVQALPYYGSVFFFVQDNTVDKSGYFVGDSDIMCLGVNQLGIHFFIKGKHKFSHPWENVSYWRMDKSTKRYLYILVRAKKNVYYVLETPACLLINSYASSMIWRRRLMDLALANK
ncbi:FERM domain-containing protein 8-like [Schistocerca gregaria]|uniref:FERM domain-containing protein 8-like n=1 Tax=Schistocerca gregaria TaxID=7010 RepID=UPI00211F4358|nr:FERM domain-containing protein 8-like [Schistocerca gregaria]